MAILQRKICLVFAISLLQILFGKFMIFTLAYLSIYVFIDDLNAMFGDVPSKRREPVIESGVIHFITHPMYHCGTKET